MLQNDYKKHFSFHRRLPSAPNELERLRSLGDCDTYAIWAARSIKVQNLSNTDSQGKVLQPYHWKGLQDKSLSILRVLQRNLFDFIWLHAGGAGMTGSMGTSSPLGVDLRINQTCPLSFFCDPSSLMKARLTGGQNITA